MAHAQVIPSVAKQGILIWSPTDNHSLELMNYTLGMTLWRPLQTHSSDKTG